MYVTPFQKAKANLHQSKKKLKGVEIMLFKYWRESWIQGCVISLGAYMPGM